LGIGADVEVTLTNWLASGAGGAVSLKFGLVGRHPGGGIDVHAGLPLMPVLDWLSLHSPDFRCPALEAYAGLWYICTDTAVRGMSLFDDSDRESRSILFVNLFALCKHGRRENIQNKLVDRFDMDVGATLLPFSARLGFGWGQFVDFLVGWTGLDIAGDDTGGPLLPGRARNGGSWGRGRKPAAPEEFLTDYVRVYDLVDVKTGQVVWKPKPPK
jgi:hypothetical protein